jgi:hypothetical protein
MIERSGNVKAKASKKRDLTAKRLLSLVRRHVDIENAVLITDEYTGYMRIKYNNRNYTDLFGATI